MILLAFDIETTGLDKQKDRMIELGLALYSTGQNKILESAGMLVQSDGVPITPEITDLTGIQQNAVDRFGYTQQDALEAFVYLAEQADAIIGHNINRFDLPVLLNTAGRLGFSMPPLFPIDTMTDIPGVKGEQLITMCAKHGFVNPNQHSAEDDAKSVLKLIADYDINEIVVRAKSPMVVVLAHQDRGRNEDAKKLRFRWNPDRRIWWKAMKEMDYTEFAKQASFQTSIADKSISLEELDT